MNIDTLSIARDLKAAELPAGQAEAIAAAIGRAVRETTVTKADLESAFGSLDAKIDRVEASLEARIDRVEASLEARIVSLEARIDTKIEQLRTEIERTRNQLLIGFVSSQIALAGIIIAVIKL
jgi:hypothetical protein